MSAKVKQEGKVRKAVKDGRHSCRACGESIAGHLVCAMCDILTHTTGNYPCRTCGVDHSASKGVVRIACESRVKSL